MVLVQKSNISYRGKLRVKCMTIVYRRWSTLEKISSDLYLVV